jgi:hypothetical protein
MVPVLRDKLVYVNIIGDGGAAADCGEEEVKSRQNKICTLTPSGCGRLCTTMEIITRRAAPMTGN